MEADGPADDMHSWLFVSGVGAQEVVIWPSLSFPPGLSADERSAETRSFAPVLRAMLPFVQISHR